MKECQLGSCSLQRFSFAKYIFPMTNLIFYTLKMKNIISLIAILIIITFSSLSYSEWSKVTESSSSGNIIYIDPARIEKIKNFIYYFSLTDYKKPVFGDLSVIVHYQADCKHSRERGLNWVFYKRQMGQGKGVSENSHDEEWTYPSDHGSSSSRGVVLKKVCEKFL